MYGRWGGFCCTQPGILLVRLISRERELWALRKICFAGDFSFSLSAAPSDPDSHIHTLKTEEVGCLSCSQTYNESRKYKWKKLHSRSFCSTHHIKKAHTFLQYIECLTHKLGVAADIGHLPSVRSCLTLELNVEVISKTTVKIHRNEMTLWCFILCRIICSCTWRHWPLRSQQEEEAWHTLD